MPNTFPHFTQHTIEHSEEIIRQLSHLLFDENVSGGCVIHLTALEAYVLIVSAFLHDAGMVTSDAEKQQILEDQSWKTWIATTAADRWKQVENFRAHGDGDDSVRNFIADMHIRELIAEFVRRVHHRRAANVIRNQSELGRFAFDDPQLQQTISDICVAHGLARGDLDDPNLYPTLRQIRGENVNVRLLAILLRLGDLLDLRVSRACPILFNAADPIGPTSRPHWSQYGRIRHFAVTPAVIELRADCEDIDEHRVLRDWCQWIEDEGREAPRLLADSRRHNNWHPPRVSLGGDQPTITIEPARDASYLVRDWRFELDAEAIFQRLILDVHSDQYAFIKELIQNALDAMRCRMYEDLQRQGLSLPSSPAEAPAEVREKYVLRLKAEQLRVKNEQANRDETITAVTVEDPGIGMDEDIVQRHLLQVGRSYYTTEEFRRRYAFVPGSQFGIGFLTVFGVSDDVIVESLRQKSDGSGAALQLRLSGPRNYIAVARATRTQPGTRIEVRVHPDIEFKPETLTNLVKTWCRKVEFPIETTDFGAQSVTRAEQPSDFVFTVPDAEDRNATYRLRYATVADREVSGEIYWLVHESAAGENWTRGDFYQYQYAKEHPEAEIRPLPTSLRCIHGISLRESQGGRPGGISRLDYRGRARRPNLSRTSMNAPGAVGGPSDEGGNTKWRELLSEHLERTGFAQGPDGWVYRNRIADRFLAEDSFWNDISGLIPVWVDGKRELLSCGDYANLPRITELVPAWRQACLRSRSRENDSPPIEEVVRLTGSPSISHESLSRLAERVKLRMFERRAPARARWVHASWFAIDWEPSDKPPALAHQNWDNRMLFECELEPHNCVALFFDQPYSLPDLILINPHNRLGGWCVNTLRRTVDRDLARSLASVLAEAARYCFYVGEEHVLLKKHLAGWSARKDIPEELKPPEYVPTRDDFVWPSQE